MKETCKNVKKPIVLLGGIGLFIAGLLDIKYKGLLYRFIQKVACTNKS
ncbi:hypothetical protein AAGS61_13800 [Lysinibacillus sp. KU-BSD001]